MCGSVMLQAYKYRKCEYLRCVHVVRPYLSTGMYLLVIVLVVTMCVISKDCLFRNLAFYYQHPVAV